MFKIKRGLDLPISGGAEQTITNGPNVRSVALIGFDYVGMKPTMEVKEGDRVLLGQTLFTDKKTEGVKYTAPATGTVSAINRGEKRALQSVVIDIEASDEQISFKSYATDALTSIGRDEVVNQLVDSGLWTSLRTRPFSKVPALDVAPEAIFVTAIDTNPLALNPEIVIAEEQQSFIDGLAVLGQLGAQNVYCCVGVNSQVSVGNSGASLQTFEGPHPAGNAGTHIHLLAPASASRTVLSVNYQDVIAIGKLFTTGKISTDRVVAIVGPSIVKPTIVRTRIGASTEELTAGNTDGQDLRVLSGSVFNGRKANGAYAYLGRYHTQITVLPEGREREMLHYFSLGSQQHSITRTFISALNRSKLLPFNTSTNGSDRAMVPIGSYEKVMPLDILPTQLLRALLVGDTSVAQQLGCLELDEEDLALCSYVCSGKHEFGPILRDNLTRIEKEG